MRLGTTDTVFLLFALGSGAGALFVAFNKAAQRVVFADDSQEAALKKIKALKVAGVVSVLSVLVYGLSVL